MLRYLNNVVFIFLYYKLPMHQQDQFALRFRFMYTARTSALPSFKSTNCLKTMRSSTKKIGAPVWIWAYMLHQQCIYVTKQYTHDLYVFKYFIWWLRSVHLIYKFLSLLTQNNIFLKFAYFRLILQNTSDSVINCSIKIIMS